MALLFFMATPSFDCFASTDNKTQETISNLEKQTSQTKEAINQLQKQREKSEYAVADLKKQSNLYQQEINGYSGQLEEIEEQISATEEEMRTVSAEIVNLNGELEEIEQQRQDRYALLKHRMKAVYEKGGKKGMLVHILQSGSFEQMLSRTEYLNAIISYDQKKMEECRQLEGELKLKIAEVEEKEEQLNEYQSELDEKYDEIEDLTGEVRGRLDSTNSSLLYENAKLKNFDAQLKELDKKMKSLASQAAAAQAELAKQVAKNLPIVKEDTSGSYAASDSELAWLAATIQAEAGGESYTGKLAVGSVIMNRVKSSAFPNTIIAVITQNKQFASYRSGKVELIIAKGPNSTCVQAAQEVLNGARVGDYLFFMTKYYADYYGISEYTMIGNHAFFYSWKTGGKTNQTTLQPTPTPTPTPSPTPEPTPTTKPTTAPTTTPNPTPTTEPEPTTEPTPTEEPTPTTSPTPTEEPSPVPKPSEETTTPTPDVD